MKKKIDLFNEFDEVSAKAWKQKIQVDLKGLEYNETLITQTPEGIQIKPFYHPEGWKQLPHFSSSKKFKICEQLEVKDASIGNSGIKQGIKGGTEGFLLICHNEHLDIKKLFEGLDLYDVEFHLDFKNYSLDLLKVLSDLEHKKNIYIHFDILGNLARTGNWFENLKADHELLENINKHALEFGSVISIDTSLYQNAGANAVQQLAYTLAHATEYLNHLGNDLKGTVILKVSVGSNYFMEIAKLKALRWLWESLNSSFDIDLDCLILARPSLRNKSVYDYNNNLLRSTSECMSAILGGANSVCNIPYDQHYKNPHEFSSRIARNQLHILRHEAYFDRVNNPTQGSYYIDSLTTELAEKALDLFKDIEANGGFMKQLKEGTIQRKIKESAEKEQKKFDTNEIKILGANLFPDSEEKMKEDLERSPFIKFEERKSLIEPIIEKRLSENLEKKRLQNEN